MHHLQERVRTDSTVLLVLLGVLGWGGAVLWQRSGADELELCTWESVRPTAITAAASVVEEPPPQGEAVAPSERRPAVPGAGYGHANGPAVTKPRSDRSATLDVELTRQGRPVHGTVRFLSGPHGGSRPAPIVGGSASLGGCLPGVCVVQVEDESGFFTQREIVLRPARRGRITVDFGDHGMVRGRVTDRDGVGFAGALLTLDDQQASSDHDGHFQLARTSSGKATLIVQCEGFTTLSRILSPGESSVAEELRPFRLLPAARATVQLIGVTGGVDFQVLPVVRGARKAGHAAHLDGYPWSRLGPLKLRAGGKLHLDDLPPCALRMVAVGGGTGGTSGTFWLKRGTEATVEVCVEASAYVGGRAVRDGTAVEGVRIELIPENPAGARREVLGKDRSLLDRYPVGPISDLHQISSSDARGDFQLRPYELSRERFQVRITDEFHREYVTQSLNQSEDSTSWTIDLAELSPPCP